MESDRPDQVLQGRGQLRRRLETVRHRERRGRRRLRLAPVGGLGTDYYIDDGGVAHNSFYQYQSDRPQDYVGGDANYFAGKHEVKFGGAWRSTPVDDAADLAGQPPGRELGQLSRT